MSTESLKKGCAGARIRRQDWDLEEAKLIDNDYWKWEREISKGQSPELKAAHAAREAQWEQDKKALGERIKQAVEDYIAAHPSES